MDVRQCANRLGAGILAAQLGLGCASVSAPTAPPLPTKTPSAQPAASLEPSTPPTPTSTEAAMVNLNGRIAYWATTDGPPLYVRDLPEGDPVEVTLPTDPSPFLAPGDFWVWFDPAGLALSPDGEQLAVVFPVFNPHGTDTATVILVDLSAGTSTDLEVSVRGTPSWSPDGRHLAMAAVDPNDFLSSNLSVMRLESGEISELVPAQPGWWITDSSWSPDGSQIAFIGRASEVDVHQARLMVVSPDGGEPSDALADEFSFILGIDWSPNGAQIAMAAARGREDSNLLYLVDPFNRGTPAPVTNGLSGSAWSPAWSPDGSTLLFASGPGLYALRLDLDGGQPVRVFEGAFPTWSLSPGS